MIFRLFRAAAAAAFLALLVPAGLLAQTADAADSAGPTDVAVTSVPAASEPAYSLLGEAGLQLDLNYASWDPADPLAKFKYSFYGEFKHRYAADKFEVVINHGLTLAQPSGGNVAGDVVLSPRLYEGYVLYKPADGLDLYLGQKRLALGIGHTVTVGDTFNPLLGFFDAKTGPRGLMANLSLGANFGLAGGIQAESLFNSTKPDPTKLTGAVQANWLLDKLQILSSLVWQPDKTLNPGLGLSYDLGGFILTAEGAGEFLSQHNYPTTSGWKRPEPLTEPRWSGSAGARYNWIGDDFSFTVACEYLYAGQGWTLSETDAWRALPVNGLRSPGLLNQNYLFPKLVLGWESLAGLTTAAFVNLDDGSVLLNHALTLSPWEGTDFVLTARYSLGAAKTEWEKLSASPTADRGLFTLQTKVHF